MANRHRGEIEARLDGKTYRLCLTLGALAELEAAFGESDLVGLAERFEKGRLKAREAMAIIAAGLKGGGHEVGLEDVERMQADGGAAGYVDIVARLLTATFGGATGGGEADGAGMRAGGCPAGAAPFPGKT
ncbi:MAG: gene transfer agent family protein [Hyphomicrobiaceae bacterium]|nr:gene transfer agent family protein [Hyphomicrobiaceae bacterium]